MQILHHLNSFIQALGCAMKINVIALHPPSYTTLPRGKTRGEKGGEKRVNAFIFYSQWLVAFCSTRLVTFHFAAFQALSPTVRFFSFILYWAKDDIFQMMRTCNPEFKQVHSDKAAATLKYGGKETSICLINNKFCFIYRLVAVQAQKVKDI